MVCDLVRQCSRVGELRSALEAGTMKEGDVYAELGDVVNGDKVSGRRARARSLETGRLDGEFCWLSLAFAQSATTAMPLLAAVFDFPSFRSQPPPTIACLGGPTSR